jgi:hypothetical protein
MEQNRRHRNKPMLQLFLTKETKTYVGENTASSTNSARKIGYPHVED